MILPPFLFNLCVYLLNMAFWPYPDVPDFLHVTNEAGETAPLVLPIIQPSPDVSSRPWIRYPYQLLPTPTSIRILRLDISDQLGSAADLVTSPVRGSIIVRDLRDDPKYIALSYTWGDPLTLYDERDPVSPPNDWTAPAFEIFCDGHPVSVTTNLYTALLSLRARAVAGEWQTSVAGRKDKWRPVGRSPSTESSPNDPDRLVSVQTYDVWIDAVCINQADVAERASQVGIMQHIFSRAIVVVAWLGGDDSNSRRSTQTMGRILGKLSSASRINSESWVRLYAFLNRSWFKRAWVVQEARLSRHAVFLCGLRCISMVDVLHTSFAFHYSVYTRDLILQAEAQVSGHRDPEVWGAPIDYFEEDIQVRLYRPRPTPGYTPNVLPHMLLNRGYCAFHRQDYRPISSLGKALELFRSTIASDPRDKVFAFLGLLSDLRFDLKQSPPLTFSKTTRDVPAPVPDYTKSVTQVYTDASVYLMQSTTNLIQLFELKEPRFEDEAGALPSWVPDFSIAARGVFDLFEPRCIKMWATCGSVKSNCFRLLDERTLRVSGRRVAHIEHKAAQAYSVDTLPEIADLLTHIPEESEIRAPRLTAPVLSFHSLDKSADKARLLRLKGTHAGQVTIQSRFEVLWRTLLHNKWNDDISMDLWRGYPAPEGLGEVFLALIKQGITMLRLRLLEPMFGHYTDFAAYSGIILVKHPYPRSFSTCTERNYYGERQKLMTAAYEKFKGERAWDDDVVPDQFLIDIDGMYKDIPPAFPGVGSMLASYGDPTTGKPSNVPERLLQGSSIPSGHHIKKSVELVVSQYGSDCRLFVTSTARLGLGPHTAREGTRYGSWKAARCRLC
ncbi:unnamed protein product [Parascedosporium putredinis]|uniref:Heterokaryon incompatibility domain-containing protein n=1 Tax=Parascedosporium putredinis TaxID=1442378 RepID=A0A9P1M982_9PEZI|nr:unnamed protein product [Parascedosporium putredinis]CAI7991550.1 unnamed protein product [Parascedosporium putredinis]